MAEIRSGYHFVDLNLPEDKTPTAFRTQKKGTFFENVSSVFKQELPQPDYKSTNQYNKTPDVPLLTGAVGTKDQVHFENDTGLFGTIFEVWANHLNLRTSPEDWWLPLITTVAVRVDDHADTQELRSFFVGGRQGKETISVEVPSFSIYDTDYTYLFNQFSTEIDKRIQVPGYVEAVSSKFSTTTADQRVASQITLMKSFQKYFDYRMMICGCGIKAVEMSGKEEDWVNLREKLKVLQKLLAPIENILKLKAYFSAAETVYENLIKTYKKDPSMASWWSKILIDCKVTEYGPSGMKMGEVKAYNGWIVQFLTGSEHLKLKAKNLAKGEYAKELSGLSSCPMKIVDTINKVEDNSTLVAGILGYTSHQDAPNGVISLQPSHGWCMMLPANSPLRRKK